MGLARKWCVLLAVHGHASLEVSIWADQNLLMPLPRSQQPLQMLDRIAGALVDFREGDAITAVVHGAGPIAAWDGTNVHLALHWMASTLTDAWWPPKEHDLTAPFDDAPVTGIRRKFVAREQGETARSGADTLKRAARRN